MVADPRPVPLYGWTTVCPWERWWALTGSAIMNVCLQNPLFQFCTIMLDTTSIRIDRILEHSDPAWETLKPSLKMG